MSDKHDNTENPKQKTLWRLSPLQICQRFEEELKTKKDCRAENVAFLRAVSKVDRDPLLYGLLQREMAFRESTDSPLSRQELETRFPAEKALVDAVCSSNLPLEQISAALRDYECLEQIKGGPIGGIYKVRNINTHQILLVRRIPDFFIDSASLAAKKDAAEVEHLFHPNLTAPIELIENSGALFVVTEYFEGKNIPELVEGHHPIPVPVVCEIIRQAANGLANIHGYFKAHEDIRPCNILVGIQGENAGIVKIGGIPGGLVDERQGRFAMWPSSSLLNAKPYYAPEVLSGRRQPDMLSDVYGLGMTLKNALIGDEAVPNMPASGSETYLPNPKSAPPSLCQLRPDCPPRLESIIASMTARDPDARLDGSNSFADVISEYASSSELNTWLEGVHNNKRKVLSIKKQDELPVALNAAAIEQTPPEIQPFVSISDAARAKADLVVSEQPVEVSADRQSSKPNRRRKAFAVFALCGLVLVAIAAWSARDHIIAPPASAAGPEWAAILTELPGPNGDWWFEEIPWYTPGVRAELAQRINAGDPSIDMKEVQKLANNLQSYPKIATVKLLEGLVRKMMDTIPDKQAIIVRQILEVDPQAHTVSKLKEEYADILVELQSAPVDTPTKAHLRATLLMASSNYDEAAAAYQQALEMYKSSPDSQLNGLHALCASDYGKLLVSDKRDYKKANVYYRLGNELAGTTSLDVVCLCDLADSFRKWGQHDNASKTLLEAQLLISDQSKLISEHPLRAVVYETQGWAALDNWQLADAQSNFKAAKDIRMKHRSAGNPRSWRSILWIEQGEAMTAHFQGNQQEAQKKYRTLLEQIDSSLRGGVTRQLPEQQKTELAARLPNINERLADCYLFGAGVNHKEACKALHQAIVETQRSSFDSEKLWPHILALKFKYAMALDLDGEHEEAEKVFTNAESQIETLTQNSNISDGQKNIYEPMQLVASSVMHLDYGEEDQRKAAIQALNQFYSTATAKVTRKNVDLVLMVSEELLRPGLVDPENALRIVRRLEEVTNKLRSADNERHISVYLHRYCESAKLALQFAPARDVNSDYAKMLTFLDRLLEESAPNVSEKSRGLSRIPLDESGKPLNSRLHVLTVGVSEYENHPQLALQYADDDAEALHDALGILCKDDTQLAGSQGLFQRGQFLKLTNKEATKTAIVEAIDKMSRAATEDDLFIVSFAGHGTLNEDQQFFFLPNDYREESLQASAIWIDELRNMLGRRNNAILVLDACHSGAATTVGMRAASGQDVQNALHRFTTAQKGLVVLAASGSEQKAIEKKGHGVLTLALLEALKGDYDPGAVAVSGDQKFGLPQLPQSRTQDGLITLREINYYVEARVAYLTDGKQMARITRTGGDFSMSDIPIRIPTAKPQP